MTASTSKDGQEHEVHKAVSRELVRPRPERRSDQDRTRVVLVRQPIKDVTPDTGRDVVVRYIVVALALVVLIGSLLTALGALGATLGFEDAFGLPRRQINLATSFIEGTAVVAEIPSIVLRGGETAVLLPVLGFICVGIPAALLALARPRIPGARQPRAGVRALAATGAIIGVCTAVAAVIWCIVPWRATIVSSMPPALAGYIDWHKLLELIAGIDAFVFVALVLWCILAFRFPLPRWGQTLTSVILLACTAMVFVAMARSNGVVRGLDTVRPVTEAGNSLLIGEMAGGQLVASVTGTAFNFGNTSDVFSSAIVTAPVSFQGRNSLNELLREASSTQRPLPRP